MTRKAPAPALLFPLLTLPFVDLVRGHNARCRKRPHISCERSGSSLLGTDRPDRPVAGARVASRRATLRDNLGLRAAPARSRAHHHRGLTATGRSLRPGRQGVSRLSSRAVEGALERPRTVAICFRVYARRVCCDSVDGTHPRYRSCLTFSHGDFNRSVMGGLTPNDSSVRFNSCLFGCR